MKLILFTKPFKEKSLPELAALAHRGRFDGFDLCVRPGYPVQPDNIAATLPAAADFLKKDGLSIAMVTGPTDLLYADQPGVEPLLEAMDRSDIRLLKLGYYRFDPLKHEYWTEVERIRKAFDGWQECSRRYGVRICYHTHSRRCMGLNCAALAHLIRGFDPACIGAFVDPCHMLIEGEEFGVGVAMIREHLRVIALKDVSLFRTEKNSHGTLDRRMERAGQGMVDWTVVFDELQRIAYDGPLTVHCEFKVAEDQLDDAACHEARFFRAQMARIGSLQP